MFGVGANQSEGLEEENIDQGSDKNEESTRATPKRIRIRRKIIIKRKKKNSKPKHRRM